MLNPLGTGRHAARVPRNIGHSRRPDQRADGMPILQWGHLAECDDLARDFEAGISDVPGGGG